MFWPFIPGNYSFLCCLPKKVKEEGASPIFVSLRHVERARRVQPQPVPRKSEVFPAVLTFFVPFISSLLLCSTFRAGTLP